MTDVKLPVRMTPDGNDWVPAWRLRDYEAAVDALAQIIADGEPYFEDGAAAFNPDDESIAAGRAALARLRGDWKEPLRDLDRALVDAEGFQP